MEEALPTNSSPSILYTLNDESEALGEGPVLQMLEGNTGVGNNCVMGRLLSMVGRYNLICGRNLGS
jgi:hypothetical protein